MLILPPLGGIRWRLLPRACLRSAVPGSLLTGTRCASDREALQCKIMFRLGVGDSRTGLVPQPFLRIVFR